MSVTERKKRKSDLATLRGRCVPAREIPRDREVNLGRGHSNQGAPASFVTSQVLSPTVPFCAPSLPIELSGARRATISHNLGERSIGTSRDLRQKTGEQS